MSEQKFKAGDVVWLKSGGQKMTISSYSDLLLQYNCVWFDKKQEPQDRGFDESVLTDIEP